MVGVEVVAMQEVEVSEGTDGSYDDGVGPSRAPPSLFPLCKMTSLQNIPTSSPLSPSQTEEENIYMPNKRTLARETRKQMDLQSHLPHTMITFYEPP